MRISNKLNNNRGASISVALLFFLVCAVIGSVVLTAGMAAAGRYSKLVESDKRYYCVNSAVGLLTDIIENEHPSVSLTCTSTTYTLTKIKDGVRTVLQNTEDKSFDIDGALPSSPTVFDDLAKTLYVGSGSITESIWNNGVTPETDFVKKFNINVSSGGAEKTELTAAVELRADKNGNLTVTVSSGGDSDVYSVVMTFQADSNVAYNTTDRKTVTDTGVYYESDEVTIYTLEESTTTETTQKTVTMSFKRTDVK